MYLNAILTNVLKKYACIAFILVSHYNVNIFFTSQMFLSLHCSHTLHKHLKCTATNVYENVNFFFPDRGGGKGSSSLLFTKAKKGIRKEKARAKEKAKESLERARVIGKAKDQRERTLVA